MMINTDIFINNTGPYQYDMHTETEQIEVPPTLSEFKPDPNWYHVDSNGHFHTFDAKDGSLPTLLHVREENSSCECVTLEYRCLLCEETVEPHWISATSSVFRQYVPGPTHFQFEIYGYSRSVDRSQKVSFYTSDFFGIGIIKGIHLMDGSVNVSMDAINLATRGTTELPGLPTSQAD